MAINKDLTVNQLEAHAETYRDKIRQATFDFETDTGVKAQGCSIVWGPSQMGAGQETPTVYFAIGLQLGEMPPIPHQGAGSGLSA